MEELSNQISLFFQKVPNVIYIALFGSYARNKPTQESDVDIAVLFEKAHVPEPLTLITLREQLVDLLNKEVDLVCLNTASPIIGMQVYKNGKTILINHSREYANYQMALFTDYAELKTLRLPMEKNILKRKYYDR